MTTRDLGLQIYLTFGMKRDKILTGLCTQVFRDIPPFNLRESQKHTQRATLKIGILTFAM